MSENARGEFLPRLAKLEDRAELETLIALSGERLYAAFGFAVVERYEIALGNGEHLPVAKMTRRYSCDGLRGARW